MRNCCPCEGSHKSERTVALWVYESSSHMEREDGGERGRKIYLTNGALKLALSINLWQLMPVKRGSQGNWVLGTLNLSGFKEIMAHSHAHPCYCSCSRSSHPWRQARAPVLAHKKCELRSRWAMNAFNRRESA